MIPMTMCDVKGFAYSAGTTDDYHPIPHFPSTIRSILVSFSSLFWFYSSQPYSFSSHQPNFQQQQAVVFSKKSS